MSATDPLIFVIDDDRDVRAALKRRCATKATR